MKTTFFMFFGSDERDDRLSWRKMLTAIAALAFIFSVIGFLYGLPELPREYQAIIAMVFTYYFVKKVIDNIQIGSKK